MKDTTSAKILSIRAKAGNENKVCPTCGKSPGSPYRRQDARGRITEGCIDAIHTDQLYGESARWHDKTEAKQIRRNELQSLTGKIKGR